MRCVCVLDSEFFYWNLCSGDEYKQQSFTEKLLTCLYWMGTWYLKVKSGADGPMGVDGPVNVGESVFAWSFYWEKRSVEFKFIRKHTELVHSWHAWSYIVIPALSFQCWESQTFKIILSYIASLRPALDIWEPKQRNPQKYKTPELGK